MTESNPEILNSLADRSEQFDNLRDMVAGAPTLDEAVGLAAGAISMCWDPIPSGVFDSERAGVLTDAILDRVRSYFG